AAEVALESPAPGSVSVEESGVDGRGTERDVGAVVTGRAGALGEQRDPERVLRRALARLARPLDTRCDVDPDGGHRPEGTRDIRGCEASCKHDRQVARDRARETLRGPGAGAARVLPAGGV